MTETLLDILVNFWGKADRDNPSRMLPAVFHMLDVAHVAEQMILALPKKERDVLVAPFELSANPVKVLAWLIALHDIGKLAPGFQYKLKRYLKIDQALYHEGDKDETNHGASSMAIIRRIFEQSPLDLSKSAIKTLATFAASHHGRYEWGAHFSNKSQYGDQNWQVLQQDAVDWLMQQFGLTWEIIKIDQARLTKEWLVYAAGLCAVSDWIGSDQSIFNYDRTSYENFEAQSSDLMAESQKRLAALKIKHGIFAGSGFEFSRSYRFLPNPLQQACLEVVREQQWPDLVIIEAPMGEGKTEAAQILSYHLAREKGCSGVYFAMPTQASSNQLYRRMLEFIRSLEGVDQSIETHLLHANAELNLDYDGLKTSSINGKGALENLSADQWFTGKKKGLLSSCAVGTIDQLLMAGMRVKHHFVRLFGLANKVVVLDEVHALDSYQKGLLKNLLTWLSSLGSPVIMLSATLPETMKKELVRAYFNSDSYEPAEASYPRLSLFAVGRSPVVRHIKPIDDELKSTYRFKLSECHHSNLVRQMSQNVIADLQQAQHGVIVCIVNTVSRAQSLFKAIKNRMADLDALDSNDVIVLLAHARFPMFKRIEIEQEIERLLGAYKPDRMAINPDRPRRMILIGSQVLEQSLDYSGDKLHSELAPIDLLLQRLGRIHRHKINSLMMSAHFRVPTCAVYLPTNLDELSSDAEGTFGFANANIYPPSILLKTAMLLRAKLVGNAVELELPEAIDSFVQEVYCGNFELPEAGKDWEYLCGLTEAQKTRLAERKLFKADVDDVEELIGQMSEDLEDDNLDMSTRLALPSITLVLLKQSPDGLWQTLDSEAIEVSDKFSRSALKALRRSSLSISDQKWVQYFSSDSYQCAFWKDSRTKTLWQKTSLLYGCQPLCLDENNEYHANGVGKLSWNEELGLCW